MAGFTSETAWSAGRPLTEIPAALVKILETTYRDKRDYLVDGDEDDADAQELIRYGKLYAQRKNLSFRHRFTDDGKLRFCMTDKRKYTKKASA